MCCSASLSNDCFECVDLTGMLTLILDNATCSLEFLKRDLALVFWIGKKQNIPMLITHFDGSNENALVKSKVNKRM